MSKPLNTKKRKPGPIGLTDDEFEMVIKKVYQMLKLEIDITRERRDFSTKRPLLRIKR